MPLVIIGQFQKSSLKKFETPAKRHFSTRRRARSRVQRARAPRTRAFIHLPRSFAVDVGGGEMSFTEMLAHANALGRLDASLPPPAHRDGDEDDGEDEDEDTFGSLGSLSPSGSASVVEAGKAREGEATRRAPRKSTDANPWSMKQELYAYECYMRSAGDFGATWELIRKAPGHRGRLRTHVRSFFTNALRRINASILKKSLGVEIDVKNAFEVCCAFKAYSIFRIRESVGEQTSQEFGRRFNSENGLRAKCANELASRLKPLIARPEWCALQLPSRSSEEALSVLVDSAKKPSVNAVPRSPDAIAGAEGMEATPACVVMDGKPRFVLQLFPIDDDVERAMHENNYKPLMELTFRQRKTVPGLIAHLSEKWLNAAPSASHRLQLYPFEAKETPPTTCWNATCTHVTAMDIYAELGSPRCFRLRYGWSDKLTAPRAAAPMLATPTPTSGDKRKMSPTSVPALGAIKFDPIPGGVIPGDVHIDDHDVARKAPRVTSTTTKAPLNLGGDFTLSDFNGSGFTNLFGTDLASRQPLANVNSPSKPKAHRPNPAIWASPRKKGEALPPSDASLLRVLDGIGAPDDGAVGMPGDTMGIMTDSIMFDGSMGFGALFGDATRSRAVGARNKSGGVAKGPTSFSGMFDK